MIVAASPGHGEARADSDWQPEPEASLARLLGPHGIHHGMPAWQPESLSDWPGPQRVRACLDFKFAGVRLGELP